MPSCRSLAAFALLVGGPTFWSSAARADDAPAAPDAKPADSSSSSAAASATAHDPNGPYEEEHKAYRFIGLRFRDVIVPQFMIDIFAQGGATVNVAMVGPELAIRRDHLEYDFSIQYADYSMKPFLFRGKSDGIESNELVSSSMKLVYLTIDLLYDVPLDSSGRFSFLIGGGVGLAPVFGSLFRTQAYPLNGTNPNDTNPAHWGYCTGAGQPAGTSAGAAGPNGVTWCDSSNNHYGTAAKPHEEPSWVDGGSKPVVFPWISLPQLSFRYKPIKQLQTRADVGFSITGFYFGLSAAYGL
jgi:hypothetical protein